jgi:hypothetical protein
MVPVADPVPALMAQALVCLNEAVQLNPGTPQHIGPRVGTEVLHDLGQWSDTCCEGLAYTMLGDTYISSDSFPEQDIIRQIQGSCAPPAWAQEFQMGIVRCISAGQADGEPPSDAQWAEAAVQNMYDSQSLRRAACCFRNWINASPPDLYIGMNVVINRQVQTNPNGGCVERYVTLVVQFPDVDCRCG